MIKEIKIWLKTKWKQLLMWFGIGTVAMAAVLSNVGAPLEISLTDDVSFDKMLEEYETQTTTTDQLVRVQDKYKMQNTALIMPVKNRNAIEVKLGDSTADSFLPEIEISRWNETSFKIKPDISAVSIKDRTLQFEGDKVRLETPKIDYKFYDIPATSTHPEGAYEFEIILKEAPPSNVITVDIETEGLDFYYQPALTQQEIDDGAFRPENVIGSYAVYHSTEQGDYSKLGGNNYKTGKAFHIYRPKIIDENGDWIWGELNINSNMTITIDPKWLDNAIYPVIVDPTFGRTSIGASVIGSWTGEITCNRRTLEGLGIPSIVATSISWYGEDGNGSSGNYKLALYDDSDESFIKGTNEGTPGADYTWLTQNFTGGNPTLVEGQDIYICFWGDASVGARYDTVASGLSTFDQTEVYNGFPATLQPTNYTYGWSIYLTYSCNTPTASDFLYKKEITIEAGNTSIGYVGGVATTSDGAFVIVATTTDANLAATSSSGRIENVYENDGANNDNEYPLDIALFDNDESTPLSFEIEDYSSTTGETVFWVEVADGMSSTSDRIIFMYYGYDGGVGYSCAQEAWNGADYDPVGVWHLPETPTVDAYAYDSSDNNNDGTFNGTMLAEDQVAGQLDGSLDFDGDNDYLGGFGADELDFNAQDFSVVLWYNADDLSSDKFLFDKRAGTDAGYNLFYDQSQAKWKWTVEGTGGAYCQAQDSVSTQTESWRHLVVIYDTSGTCKIYMNSVKTADTEASDNPTNLDTRNARILNIGRDSDTADYFNGLIDEARIYDKALTQADITTIYNMEVDNATFLTWGAEQETAAGVTQPDDVQFWLRDGTVRCIQGKCWIK